MSYTACQKQKIWFKNKLKVLYWTQVWSICYKDNRLCINGVDSKLDQCLKKLNFKSQKNERQDSFNVVHKLPFILSVYVNTIRCTLYEEEEAQVRFRRDQILRSSHTEIPDTQKNEIKNIEIDISSNSWTCLLVIELILFYRWIQSQESNTIFWLFNENYF